MSSYGPTRTILAARIAAVISGKADFSAKLPNFAENGGAASTKSANRTGTRPAANPQTSCHEPTPIRQQPRADPAAT
jgi:hypothetical protein